MSEDDWGRGSYLFICLSDIDVKLIIRGFSSVHSSTKLLRVKCKMWSKGIILLLQHYAHFACRPNRCRFDSDQLRGHNCRFDSDQLKVHKESQISQIVSSSAVNRGLRWNKWLWYMFGCLSIRYWFAFFPRGINSRKLLQGCRTSPCNFWDSMNWSQEVIQGFFLCWVNLGHCLTKWKF